MSSFNANCRAIRTDTQALICLKLEKAKVPRSASAGQKRLLRLVSAFPVTAEQTRLKRALLDKIKATKTNNAAAEAIVSLVYPEGTLERTLRKMGYKLGLAGPGAGLGVNQPRFCLETPALALLVYCTVPRQSSMPLAEWIDALYSDYGIVLGLGRDSEPDILKSTLMPPATLRSALESNTNLLEKRMLQAGLAVEVSDGETEVINDAP